ncbi:MAG TPA: hypothetical protein VGE97_00930 [Nitrososphaera sp.]|jgi:hypothetical protein
MQAGESDHQYKIRVAFARSLFSRSAYSAAGLLQEKLQPLGMKAPFLSVMMQTIYMKKHKDNLDDQIPAYGLEALVSLIDDKSTLIAALNAAGKRFSLFRRHLDQGKAY